MAEIDALVEAFLSQKRIAVVGVSDQRDTGCNTAYARFKEAGYEVFPVNPRIPEYEASPCYPNLKAIPQIPEAVFILANPKVTDQIIQECIELGIKHVWMHCMMGTRPGMVASITSVSQDAVQRCHDNGISVIPGSCPNQFLNPDFFHGLMRVLWRSLGFMKIEASVAPEPSK